MTTSEDIAIEIRKLLLADPIDGLTVSWQRSGYEQSKEVVVVPHTATGEGSIRMAVVVLNIHCPDIFDTATNTYEPDFASLASLRHAVILLVEHHVLTGTGINLRVTALNPITKEPQYNEHFCSLYVTAYIRERNN